MSKLISKDQKLKETERLKENRAHVKIPSIVGRGEDDITTNPVNSKLLNFNGIICMSCSTTMHKLLMQVGKKNQLYKVASWRGRQHARILRWSCNYSGGMQHGGQGGATCPMPPTEEAK